jgi:hypothetical protein
MRPPVRSFPRTVKTADDRLRELLARALDAGVSAAELEAAIRGLRRRSARTVDRSR